MLELRIEGMLTVVSAGSQGGRIADGLCNYIQT